MRSMNERAALLDGKLESKSEAGEGTFLRLILPPPVCSTEGQNESSIN